MSIGDMITGTVKAVWDGTTGAVKGALGNGFLGGLVGAVIGAAALGGLAFALQLGGWVIGLAAAFGAITFGATGATTGAAYGTVTGAIDGVRDGQDSSISQIRDQTRALAQENNRKAGLIASASGFNNEFARTDNAARMAERATGAPGMNR